MRNMFAKTVTELAAEYPELILLSGDIGNKLFDNYKEKHQERFLNCGVAEANMASMAAGMAIAGLKPITYTIAAFNSLRNFEQIKLDICYQNLPVLVVGVGAGLSYANLNATHHALEDVACLRAVPNSTILAPADPTEVKVLLQQWFATESGPTYMRLGKKGEPAIYDSEPELTIGKAYTYQPGKKVVLLSTGHIMNVVLQVNAQLQQAGLQPEILSFHTIKPLDTATLQRCCREFDLLVSFEEHALAGGFSSAVCEWMIDDNQLTTPFRRYGISDRFIYASTSREYALQQHGLSADVIAKDILELL